MQILFNEQSRTFHLTNDKISYIMTVLPNGHLSQVYFGKKVHDKADFSYLIQSCARPTTSYISEEFHNIISLSHILFMVLLIIVSLLLKFARQTAVKFLTSIIRVILSAMANQNLKIYLLLIQKMMMKLSL